MKTKHITLYLVIVFTYLVYSQQLNDPIKNHSGIPIISYQGLSFEFVGDTSLFRRVEESGVFSLVSDDLTKPNFEEYIKKYDLLVMPQQVHKNLQNHIYRYTEAIYTVWEAEGTPESEGKVTLYNDSLENEINNGMVRTLPNTPSGTLIYGPMYDQQRHYAFVDSGEIINYTADFHMMLELETVSSVNIRPEDTVCVIQVTTTRTYNNNQWGWYDVYEIASKVIRYRDFQRLGELESFKLNYNLSKVPNWADESMLNPGTMNHIQDIETQRKAVKCIEFKVIWKGNPEVSRLSVDKIVVSDERGRDLFHQSFPTDSIKSQLLNNWSYFTANRIVDWISVDKPMSIDQMAAMKKVNELIDSVQPNTGLWVNFNGNYNGRFGNAKVPTNSSGVYIYRMQSGGFSDIKKLIIIK